MPHKSQIYTHTISNKHTHTASHNTYMSELVILRDVIEGGQVPGEPGVAQVAGIVHDIDAQLVLQLDHLGRHGEPQEHKGTLSTAQIYRITQ